MNIDIINIYASHTKKYISNDILDKTNQNPTKIVLNIHNEENLHCTKLYNDIALYPKQGDTVILIGNDFDFNINSILNMKTKKYINVIIVMDDDDMTWKSFSIETIKWMNVLGLSHNPFDNNFSSLMEVLKSEYRFGTVYTYVEICKLLYAWWLDEFDYYGSVIDCLRDAEKNGLVEIIQQSNNHKKDYHTSLFRLPKKEIENLLEVYYSSVDKTLKQQYLKFYSDEYCNELPHKLNPMIIDMQRYIRHINIRRSLSPSE